MIVQHIITRVSRATIPGASLQSKSHFGVGYQKGALGTATRAQRWCSCVRAQRAPASTPFLMRRRCVRASCPREASSSRVAQAQCPRAKMAARCSTRWLLVAVGTPRPPAAAGAGARPPRWGVVGASLGRKLSVTALVPSLGARGPGALLTLRPGVSLTGEGRLRRRVGAPRSGRE